MTIHRLASAFAAMALIGCGSQAASTARDAGAEPAGRPYELYTHCGIEWAKIEGTFWRAAHPLSDGRGNPPPGWGNPLQAGTLVFTSRVTARFQSRAGTVTFRRTARRSPPVLCS